MVNRELVYENSDMEIYEDEFGKIIIQEKSHQSVVMVALENENLILINQYRPAVDESIVQLPGGGLKEGEDVENGAKRELIEETGVVCGKTVYLGSIQPSACYANSLTHVYFTNDIIEYRSQMLEKKEASIQAFHIPVDRAFSNIEKGYWKDSEMVHGLLLARLKGLI